MQLKALTKSGTEMTDGRCQSDRMTGLRGGRELTTTQVAKLVSTGWSALSDLRREVPAKVNSYHGGRLCCSKNVGASLLGSLLCRCEERDSSLTLGTGSAISAGSQTRLSLPDKSGLAMTKGHGAG